MRSRHSVSTCTLALLLMGLTGLAGQQPPQRATGSVSEGVTAVLVDVVVRDRRGQPVRDLTDADFELLEDGVPQKLGSFTPVFPGSPSVAAAASTVAHPPATADPGATGAPPPLASAPVVTALVFHNLSPEARRRALVAAQNYVGDKEETENYVGVFGMDLTLYPLVPFSRNGVVVRKALARIAAGGAPGFNTAEQQQQRASAEQRSLSAARGTAAAVASAGPGTASEVANTAPDAMLARMEADMVRGFQAIDRDQQGYMAVDALFAIVNTLGRLPGRKSVVFFSEGIAVPAAVHRLFLGVIDAANRANVSIYTVDAAGLRADSDQAKIRDAVNSAATTGIETSYSGSGVGGAMIRELESNEDNLRSDPQGVLGQLAQETGGLMFSNTNNLRPAFDRVDSDQRNYYLLGYTPLNPAYDGRFRKIQVKVKRGNVSVSARRGYFAVRNPGTVPINPTEAPALAALDQRPVPNAFPIRAGALLFPERGRPGLIPVVVEWKTASMKFQPAADGKHYTSDFAVVVRFLDKDNQVVRKLSQHYEIRGEIAQMERARQQGEVLFYRESELPPGLYSMETAVHDALSGASSVRFATVEVPQLADGKLRMSSLVLVKRGENLSDQRAQSPLLVNGVSIQPNLGDAVSKASKDLAFYFAIYPPPGSRSPDVAIELVQNGAVLTRLPMPVPPPDESGRIQQLGRLPLQGVAPGTYELRAIVRQGDEQMLRSTLLRITE